MEDVVYDPYRFYSAGDEGVCAEGGVKLEPAVHGGFVLAGLHDGGIVVRGQVA